MPLVLLPLCLAYGTLGLLEFLSLSTISMDERYDPQKIENAAQECWEKHNSFKVVENPTREKFHYLLMVPYPIWAFA